MNYRLVDLGVDYPGNITDFALARNSFLSQLPDNEYILWKSQDEEIPSKLTQHLDTLIPNKPYYWIKRINLWNGKYRSSWNPDYSPHLVSNKVVYSGKVHETVLPKNPHGKIDIPIIHNHIGPVSYLQVKGSPLRRAISKAITVMRYGE